MNVSIKPAEFVQIIHDPVQKHWLLISTIGAEKSEVLVYDSLYSTCCTNVKQQIASLLKTEETSINLQVVDVHTQSGGSDCGLYAIAYATALCLGMELFDFSNPK